MTFFTVYPITEIAYGFHSLGRMAMAPLIAHVSLRVYQQAMKRPAMRFSLAFLRAPAAQAPHHVPRV
jgi:hypothetical protein